MRRVLARDESADPVLTTVAVAVAALVALAGRLPGYAKLGRDLRPADAQAYRMVDQHRELRFCRLSHDLDTLDPLQQLGWRQLGNLRWGSGGSPGSGRLRTGCLCLTLA